MGSSEIEDNDREFTTAWDFGYSSTSDSNSTHPYLENFYVHSFSCLSCPLLLYVVHWVSEIFVGLIINTWLLLAH